MFKIYTPNFQRQHYLYWCNVYNLSHGSPKKALPDTTIRVECKVIKKYSYCNSNDEKKV